uniref:Uncharacterized protein n=1 Tax=Thermus tengchongensis TaxID=1214928 RepID=A0A7V4E5U0_9DEIN
MKPHPLYQGLLQVGQSGRNGVVTYYSGEKKVDLHVAGGYLLKATGLVPLCLFCEEVDGDEIEAVGRLLLKRPPEEVWRHLAVQASATLLGMPSLLGKKRLTFLEAPIPSVLYLVGAGFRLNETVLSLFFPEGEEVFAMDEWEDVFTL